MVITLCHYCSVFVVGVLKVMVIRYYNIYGDTGGGCSIVLILIIDTANELNQWMCLL